MPIFQDHFLDNRNDWEIRDDDNALLRIGTGDYAYVVHHKHKQGEWTTWQPFFIDDDWSYKIHAVIERVSGSNYGYGLIWRCQNEDNCYSFEISQGGYFRVRRRSSGIWSDRQPWTQSKHIRPGQQAVNELMIVQLLDNAKFYVNGKAVFEMPFAKPAHEDGFGFVVNGNLSIRVHSTIVLRYIDWAEQAENDGERPFLAIDQAALDEVLNDLHQLVGMENIKQEINTLINFLKVQKLRQTRGLTQMPLSLHMVLAGPPGTGKTTVARLIGRIYHALGFVHSGHLIETDRAGLVAPFVGQTALKVDEMVEKALGGILFIDEAYALMPRGGQNGQDFGLEAIETLLKRMEDHRGKLAVIIAGYGDELHRFLQANPGVKSRFNRYFYFEHYKPQELAEIFTTFCTAHQLMLTPQAAARLHSHMTAVYHKRTRVFGNGRYARNLLEKSIERQANRIVNLEPMTDELLCTLTEADIPPELPEDTAV
jgi:hypothetical protein